MVTPHSPYAAQALGAAWAHATERQRLFATPDRDCARELVGRVFKPHRLEPHGAAHPLQATMDHLPLGLLSVNRLGYGTAVDISPGPLDDFYLIQIPVTGQAHIRVGDTEFVSDLRCASLLSPQPDLHMRWGAGNEQLILRINADCMRRFLSSWSGVRQTQAPTFDPQLPLDALPQVAQILQTLFSFSLALHALGTAPSHPPSPVQSMSAVQLQYRLLAALLSSVPHSAQATLHARTPPLAPRSVRMVEDYLVAHCHEPLTPDDLARVAGVSVRSLFLGFQRYRAISPMRLLRELRLHRAHHDLLHAAPHTQITEVALRWGFCHMGRFSQLYRDAFGESPRDTVQAARGLT